MNLGFICPRPGDGTSFYRAVAPFGYLSRKTGLHLIESPEWNWGVLSKCNAVFMQRPYSDEHLAIANLCRQMNVPLWVDYDDDYSCIPDWLPSIQDSLGSNESLDNMRAIVDSAAVVTVSTGALRHIREDAIVIPNALNTYIWPMCQSSRRDRITWRGSATHLGDIEPILPALETFHTEHMDWELHFLGSVHYRANQLGTVHSYIDILNFMEAWHGLCPAIHICPLADIPFNHAKSNNAWLEASSAGAMVVAPDFPEWRRPGILNYPEGGFGATLEEAVEMGDAKRIEAVERSRAFITENLTLDIVNRQRFEILNRFK